jgi:hypothetical protein
VYKWLQMIIGSTWLLGYDLQSWIFVLSSRSIVLGIVCCQLTLVLSKVCY